MKRRSEFVTGISIVVLFVFCSEIAVAGPGKGRDLLPRLVVANPVFDFGSVEQGTVVQHNFEVANAGKGVLKVRKIHPSCGCTAAIMDSDELPPGAKTSVKVSFDTSGFRGQKVKTIRIYTNDPQHTSKVLTIRGMVRADVELDPIRLNFERVKAGTSPSKSVVVSVRGTSLVKLNKISPRSDDLEVSVEDWTGSGRKGKIVQVKLSDSLPVGNFRSMIVVHTTSPRNPVVHIPVLARIEGDLEISPEAIAFGLLDGPLSESVSQAAKLTNRSDREIHIISIKSDNPSISAKFSSIEDGRVYEVKVTIREKTSGIVRARLRIATDHHDETQRELILPVYAIISRDGKKDRNT